MEDLDAIAPSCMTQTNPKARVEHRCCECRRTIKPGEHYWRVTGVWDHDPRTFKTCGECYDLGSRFRRYIEYAYNPPFGYLFEDMKESEVTREELLALPEKFVARDHQSLGNEHSDD